MREALLKIRRELNDYCDGCTLVDRMTEDPPDYTCLRDSLLEIECIVDAALSAPPRNCDRFADAEAARQAWLDDAENWDDFGSPRLELHEWLFALAAERKGDRA